MARNRSMRRMRNRRSKKCHSRGRRGGELTPEEKEKLGWRCTFCSEDKKKFKVYMDDSNKLYLKLLQNLSEDKAAELFHDLNDHEKKIFVQCLINNDRRLWETNTDMDVVKEQIDAENAAKKQNLMDVRTAKARWGFGDGKNLVKTPLNASDHGNAFKFRQQPTDTTLKEGGKSRRHRRARRTIKKSRKGHRMRRSYK